MINLWQWFRGGLQGRAGALVRRINRQERQLAEESAGAIQERSLALGYRARSGETLRRLLPEAFALVREAARRTIGLRHFDVQLQGGIALCHGSIAEIETGEGKTLTATLPLYLRALVGRGALLATANDYLAARDSEWMRPVFASLGLTTGTVIEGMSASDRRSAYASDITYGTVREFGFDFLKDCLTLRDAALDSPGSVASSSGNHDIRLYVNHPARRTAANAGELLQRLPWFLLVDEADSLLIDEARTPLIISGTGRETGAAASLYRWAHAATTLFLEGTHFQVAERPRRVQLSPAGRSLVRALPIPAELERFPMLDLYEYVERAILVKREYQRDRNYMVREGRLLIVDEFTGRASPDRQWQGGIHQAAEAQEGLEITARNSQMARVTVQDYCLSFRHLAGMTGTARSAASELRKVYHLPVITISTHRPSRRQWLPARIYADAEAKWEAITAAVVQVRETGRPLLIGTRSIAISEQLSKQLAAVEVPHRVLNAHRLAEEAEVVAHAGERGMVTVATNMAGRGTDIPLGAGVAELGGLFVIATEFHESQRIDRQLAGRGGRQGDPGSFLQVAALDDELLTTAFGVEKARRLAERFHPALTKSPVGSDSTLARLFHRAQRLVESRQRRDRKLMLEHEHRYQQMLVDLGLDPYLDSMDEE